MIDALDLRGLPQSSLFRYAANLPFFSNKTALRLPPGLTILFGPNGCGKSTLLNILALTMAAKQGGYSAVTEDHVRTTVDMLGALPNPRTRERKPMKDCIGVKVSHDGQPVLFADPRQAVGLIGGAFDDDFFQQGLHETMAGRKQSHGQRVLMRANPLLAVLSGQAQPPTEIVHKITEREVNDVWKAALKEVHARLEPSIPKGPMTVLLDEPESNFSLIWQQKIWALLSRPDVAQQYQVIVASHSPFCLGIPHANYLDMEPGYRKQVEKLMVQTVRERWGESAKT